MKIEAEMTIKKKPLSACWKMYVFIL